MRRVQMLALLFMWFGGSVPLVLTGAFFGFRKEAYSFPVGNNQIPRQVCHELPCTFLYHFCTNVRS